MSEKYLDLTGLQTFLNKLDTRYVPTSRTINSKALTDNITLSASDVGALASDTTYVSSVNGKSGAITDVATTNTFQTITASKTFSADLTLNNQIYLRSKNISGQYRNLIGIDANGRVAVGNSDQEIVLNCNTAIIPANPYKNLGSTSLLWKDIYLSGKLKTGTSGAIELTLPNATGTLALVSDIPSGDVDVEINGTETSTVLTLSNIVVGTTTYKNLTTFTGTSSTTGTPSGTTTVPTSSHTHSITLSGTRTTSGSGTTARRTLAITGSSSATADTISVASSGHDHTYTPQGSLS